MEHEYRHRYREAQMHEYQCCSVVQDSKCSTVDRDQRDHNYLERDYHGKQHYHEDDLIDLPCFSYEDVSCHGGEQNDQEHTHTGNDQGVLQDVHWSGGMIGYFPSYALGNLYGAQMLYKGMQRDLPNYYELIREGKVSEITKWLAEHVHSHGGTYEPKVLIEKITGEPLNAKYFLQYLEEKYSKIYGF